jgi:hypothetical protein
LIDNYCSGVRAQVHDFGGRYGEEVGKEFRLIGEDSWTDVCSEEVHSGGRFECGKVLGATVNNVNSSENLGERGRVILSEEVSAVTTISPFSIEVLIRPICNFG